MWVGLLGLVTIAVLVALKDAPAEHAPLTAAPPNGPRGNPLSLASVPLPKPSRVGVATTPPPIRGADAPCSAVAATSVSSSGPLTQEAQTALEAQRRQVLENTVAALSTSANPQAQAVALLLRPLVTELDRLRREIDLAHCASKDCATAAASSVTPPRVREFDAAAQVAFDELARMAAQSSDPRIYALAFHVCGQAGESGVAACRLISAEQWARLDPDNAVPWGFVAAAANKRIDTAAVAEAMYRIAHARGSKVGFGVLPSLVLAHAPHQEALLGSTFQVVSSAMDVEATWFARGAYQTINQFCRAGATLDANRAQVCSQIADVMTTRSDTLMERTVGAGIGRRMGWPAERLDAIKEEDRVLTQVVADLLGDPVEQSCAGERKLLAYMRSMGTDGEIGAMRRLAGQTPALEPSNLGVRGGDSGQRASYPAQPK